MMQLENIGIQVESCGAEEVRPRHPEKGAGREHASPIASVIPGGIQRADVDFPWRLATYFGDCLPGGLRQYSRERGEGTEVRCAGVALRVGTGGVGTTTQSPRGSCAARRNRGLPRTQTLSYSIQPSVPEKKMQCESSFSQSKKIREISAIFRAEIWTSG